MSANKRCIRLLLIAVAVVMLPSVGFAQDGVARQIELLREASDFRVRTQAALALGASKTKRAVEPLCRALEDSNTTVRIASAAALGKLELGGTECLSRRLGAELNAAVKGAIQRSLDRLGGGPPVIDGSTKFYLAIGATSHETGRTAVPALVRKNMARVAKSLGGYAIAPAAESAAQAQGVFQKHGQLKGFYLAPKLQVIYAGGRLTIRLSVAMLTYPDKNMIGQFARTVASPGVSQPDTAVEDELIEVAAESAMKQFAQVAANL